MIGRKRVYAIIPARGSSSRLPRKNIYPVWGKPMLYWAIQACRYSHYIDRYFVSTEDAEIAEVARSYGAEVIDRPPSLADDAIFKQEVIVHAVSSLSEKPEIVISLQPNSPQVCAHDIDAAVDKLVAHDRNEIFSVDENLLQNAALRVMKYEYVFQQSLSTTCGVIIFDYLDVHNKEDVERLERLSKPCEHYGEAKGDAAAPGS
jgi:CMP-N-acetylneuraminic acid synthetase